jgi:hypothetical protein
MSARRSWAHVIIMWMLLPEHMRCIWAHDPEAHASLLSAYPRENSFNYSNRRGSTMSRQRTSAERKYHTQEHCSPKNNPGHYKHKWRGLRICTMKQTSDLLFNGNQQMAQLAFQELSAHHPAVRAYIRPHQDKSKMGSTTAQSGETQPVLQYT